MKEYQEIRDTSPLGLKMLNDQLRLLWFKSKNATSKDIRYGSITVNHLRSDVGESLDISSNESITSKVEKNGIIAAIALTPETAKIQADKINLVGAVTVLSDITGNLGTITAGTITGATVRTSSGTSRIELSSNLLRSYLNGVRRVQLDYDSLDFYTPDNRLGGEVVGTVDSVYNLPVLTMRSNSGIAEILSRVSSTNYARVSVAGYHSGVSGSEALVDITARRSNNEGSIEVGPGGIFLDASQGSSVTTLEVSGSGGVNVYGALNVNYNKVSTADIKTGSVTLSTSWASFSFGRTLRTTPRVVLTPSTSTAGAITGKTRNVTRTGFEGAIGGSGIANTVFHYIAICE